MLLHFEYQKYIALNRPTTVIHSCAFVN